MREAKLLRKTAGETALLGNDTHFGFYQLKGIKARIGTEKAVHCGRIKLITTAPQRGAKIPLIMNVLKLSRLAGLALTVAALSTFYLNAEVSSPAIAKTLSGVRAPELPAKAAALVSRASLKDQEATAVAVVKAAIAAYPASAAAVVGAIAKATPRMASVAAAAAVSLQPKQAGAIAKAAVGAAPTEAEKIVAFMTKEAPALGSLISQAVFSSRSARATSVASSGFQSAPRVGPPFVPRTGGTGEITRTNTVIATPGDRDYSAP